MGVNKYETYLAVGLRADNLHTVPLLLCCGLHQLVGTEESNSVGVSSCAALRWGHEGGCDQENLKRDTITNTKDNDYLEAFC